MISRQPFFRPVRDNIINYDRLLREVSSAEPELELNYRSHPTTDEEDRAATAVVVSAASLGGTALLLLAFHMQAAALSIGALSFNAAIALVWTLIMIVRTGRVAATLKSSVGIVLTWPALGAMTLARDHIPGMMLLLLAFAAFVYFADAIATHYVGWLLANPRLDPTAARDWKVRWRHRFRGGLRAGPVGWLYPILLFAWAVLPGIFLQFASDSSPVDPFLVSAVVGLGAVIAFILLYHGALRPIGLATELPHNMIEILVLWCRYGAKVIPAPGLYSSPKGPYLRRVSLTFWLILLLSYWLLPAFRFFPAGLSNSPTRWAALYQSAQAEPGFTHYAQDMSHFQRSTFPTPPLPERLPGELETDYAERCDSYISVARAQWTLNEFNRYLRSHSAAWLPLMLDGVLTNDSYFLQAFVFTLLNCFLAPIIVFFVLIAAPLAFVSSVVEPAIGERSPAFRSEQSMTNWACWAERLLRSDNPKEKDHLWLGAHTYDDYPVLLDRKLLGEHAYIVGDSGSGKTALGISSIVSQLVARSEFPILIIDLKGDKDLFELVRNRTPPERFRYFTVQVGDNSYTFNPFSQNSDRLSLNQVCETLLEALHLNHGEGYGRSYYSRVARSVLSSTLRRHPNVATFTELYKLIQQNRDLDSNHKRDAYELIAVVESLTSFEQLNIAAGSRVDRDEIMRHAIHMPTVLRENQVVYFWLPAILEPASVREIAKLALYSMLIAAMQHREEHGKAKDSYIIIDEFQRIASTNFKIVLEQARSFGIGAILANQTFADLNTPDCDLRSTVQTNTRLKLTFSATDLEQQKALMDGSGEALDYRYSVSYGEQGTNVTYAEYERPRFQRNDILRASDDPMQCIVHVHRGSGYSQFTGFPLPIKCDYTIPDSVRKEWQKSPWPSGEPGTIRVGRGPLPAEVEPSVRIEEGEKIIANAGPEAQQAFDFSDEAAILAELNQERLNRSELFPGSSNQT
jgi:hypothetical protein